MQTRLIYRYIYISDSLERYYKLYHKLTLRDLCDNMSGI